MKLIGLISDTHIPSRGNSLPKSVIKAFTDVNMILHAGDFEKLQVASTLEKIAPLKAVHGNMCHHEVLKKFPKIDIINVEGVKIGLTHGSGGPSGYFERILKEFDLKGNSKIDIIVSGHTHNPIAKVFKGIQFINPGSPTDKVFTTRNTVVLLQINGSNYKYKYIDIF
ncbi:MAG: metallophosphoesterase family protein [Candidatus Hodarchaeota archaeon]